MDEQSRQIVRRLAEMAWADGEVTPQERALLMNALRAAGADPEAVHDLDNLLARPGEEAGDHSGELVAEELDEERKLGVMRALMIMSFMDGVLSFAEFAQIERTQKDLGITAEQMERLRAEALAAAEALQRGE
jgi:uncharacterized membrane protein YebE (DUF533 family)